jgi:MFS family permease
VSAPQGAAANDRAIVAAVALGVVLAPLNSTMIAVAIPAILRELDTGVAAAPWLVTPYLIVLAALPPIAGKVGDRVGRRRLILAGEAGFGAASLVAAVAGSFGMLVAARLAQAVAIALVVPNGIALVGEATDPARRGERFGVVAAATGLAAAAGPPLGGLLVSAFGWRGIFAANLVAVAVGLGLGWRVIPRRARAHVPAAFDLTGTAGLVAVLCGVAVVFAVAERGAGAAWLVTAGAAVAAAAVLFVRHELRHPDPLIQPRLFGRRPFAAANAAIALSNLAMYVTLLTVPLLVAGGHRAVGAGVLLAALSGPAVILAPVGGRLADRAGRRLPAVAGLGLLAAGLAPLALGGSATPTLAAGLAVAGVGLGISQGVLQAAAIEAAPAEFAGLAAGLASTSRYLGSITGTSALALLLAGSGSGRFTAVFGMALVAAAAALVAGTGLTGRAA